MEIIKLEFQGIGPFTDHHVVDFRQLGEGGLFLLEGPTGSGKTTILDAIAFALYGDVSGVDSSKGRIVSTMLDPSREPFVDLVIDSSRGLLRVRRTPDFERAKLRGDGTTTTRATVKLWKLASPEDTVGAPVSTNIAEASRELQQAIGLTKAQFTQTVLLPQGHFATFLRAKPEDRRDVLQDIFGTEFYERFAQKLASLAAAHRKQEELVSRSVYEVASNFCQVAWYDDAAVASEPIPEQVAFDAARDSMDFDALLDAAHERSGVLDGQLVRARHVAEAARARHAEAADKLRELESRNKLIEEFAKLKHRLDQLQERRAEVDQDQVRLGAAERAEHVRRPISNLKEAHRELAEARQQRDAALVGARVGNDADLVDGDPTADMLLAHEQSTRVEAGLLDRLVETEQNLAVRQASVAELRRALREERLRIDEGLQQVVATRAEASALAVDLNVCEATASTLASAVEKLAEATRRRDAARQVALLSSRLVEERAAESAARSELQAAEALHARDRGAWLDSLAGELAAELIDGEPCAVCGSADHPAPAVKSEGFVGREQVQARAEAKDAAAVLADQTRARSDRVADQLSDQLKLADGLNLAEASAAYAIADQERAVAEQARRDALTLRQRIETITNTADATERELREAGVALAATTGTLEETERQLAFDQSEVDTQSHGYKSISARRDALIRRAELATRLAVLFKAIETGEANATRREEELNAVLSERGFAGADEAEKSMLSDSERSRLQSVLASHREEVAAVTAQLASERYADLDGAEPVDLVPAQNAELESDKAQQDALRVSGLAEGAVKSSTLALGDLTARVEALKQLKEKAGPILRLANLANAGEGNLQQVTLPTYVLLRRFEEVVDLANVRLESMTGGRYELRRTDEKEGRSRKLGLGLEVVDHQARDSARDPKTLSGGETFISSLALALGLADAVTSEAGGIELHTLFVDEGFGSLDPDTLDAVMTQLSALREGGRSVGVVSHVAEMKQRIADRITITPRGDGTSTLFCTTDMALIG